MLTLSEWPADDYAIGSYIQATVADQYLPYIHIQPNDNILDIGCGNGAYSLKIMEQFPMASFLGIDSSENMLNLARKTVNSSKANFVLADVSNLHYINQFDYIISFWCLQWVSDIRLALHNIHRALKEGGHFFALFPFGDDQFLQTFLAVKASGQFPCLNQFISPVDYKKLQMLLHNLNDMPFKQFNIERQHHAISLPSLDTFRKFVNGIPFYKKQVSDLEIKQINEEMVNIYAKECEEKYQGNFLFDFHVYCITATK